MLDILQCLFYIGQLGLEICVQLNLIVKLVVQRFQFLFVAESNLFQLQLQLLIFYSEFRIKARFPLLRFT